MLVLRKSKQRKAFLRNDTKGNRRQLGWIRHTREKIEPMKRGDIYKNLWAGYDCYFIYQGHIRKDMVRGYCAHNAYGDSDWRWNSAQYYANSFTEDGGKNFPFVGHIDLEKIICDAVLKEVNNHGES